jgi:hypothetical protein
MYSEIVTKGFLPTTQHSLSALFSHEYRHQKTRNIQQIMEELKIAIQRMKIY